MECLETYVESPDHVKKYVSSQTSRHGLWELFKHHNPTLLTEWTAWGKE